MGQRLLALKCLSRDKQLRAFAKMKKKVFINIGTSCLSSEKLGLLQDLDVDLNPRDWIVPPNWSIPNDLSI
jgi:hypothetical protein